MQLYLWTGFGCRLGGIDNESVFMREEASCMADVFWKTANMMF